MNMQVAAVSQYNDGPKFSRIVPLICETVLPGAATKTFGPKQDVFFQGDERRSVYKIKSGALCLYTTLADGRRQIFGFAFTGDVIGLGTSDAYSYCAQAITEAVLRSLPAGKLYQLAAQDPNLALGLYHAISFELDATRDLLRAVGQQGSLERVAIFLLTLSERNGRAGKNPMLLDIPMTRADIADLLGMTLETVSRSITKLRERRLITTIRTSIIQIIDREGLTALAGQANYH